MNLVSVILLSMSLDIITNTQNLLDIEATQAFISDCLRGVKGASVIYIATTHTLTINMCGKVYLEALDSNNWNRVDKTLHIIINNCCYENSVKENSRRDWFNKYFNNLPEINYAIENDYRNKVGGSTSDRCDQQ